MSLFQSGFSESRAGTAMACVILTICTIAPLQARHMPEESTPAISQPSPPTPRLSVPEYRSPLSAYKPYVESDSPGWKELNDQVGKIGGWRFYAREAFEAEEDSAEADDMKKDSK